jgi:riboflavin kinase/FMN adenylyltransferase
MRVISWDDLVQARVSIEIPVRLSIGVFDGLHLGHRRLVAGIVEGPSDAAPLVVTFRQVPAAFFSPETFPGLILTFEQKLARLEELGIQEVVVIDFSDELSKLPAKAFIRLLEEKLTIAKIVVGSNFRFGMNRDAGTDDLKEMLAGTATEVDVAAPVLWGKSAVSSSRIRRAIKEADFSEVKAMLATGYELDLRGLPLDAEGGALRLSRDKVRQVLPGPGSYRVLYRTRVGSRPGRVKVDEDTLMLDGIADATTIVFE